MDAFRHGMLNILHFTGHTPVKSRRGASCHAGSTACMPRASHRVQLEVGNVVRGAGNVAINVTIIWVLLEESLLPRCAETKQFCIRAYGHNRHGHVLHRQVLADSLGIFCSMNVVELEHGLVLADRVAKGNELLVLVATAVRQAFQLHSERPCGSLKTVPMRRAGDPATHRSTGPARNLFLGGLGDVAQPMGGDPVQRISTEDAPPSMDHWYTLLHDDELQAQDPLRRQGSATLAIVMAFHSRQVDDVIANIRLWEQQPFFPCSAADGNTPSADLIFAAADADSQRLAEPRLWERFQAHPLPFKCFKNVYVTNLTISAEDNTYDRGPPAMFHATLNDTRLRVRHYSSLFWMEPDTFGVRPGWLDKLQTEATAAFHDAVWMVGSLQQHNRKMQSPIDYYHINGNALHDFESEAYRHFLRAARVNHPNVFDYAIHKWRMQKKRVHAHIGQNVMHKFKYTKLIQNHPTDVCMPDLCSFLERHPGTYLVHSKAIASILGGSACCVDYHESWSPLKREWTAMSQQLRCLYTAYPAAVDAILKPHFNPKLRCNQSTGAAMRTRLSVGKARP